MGAVYFLIFWLACGAAAVFFAWKHTGRKDKEPLRQGPRGPAASKPGRENHPEGPASSAIADKIWLEEETAFIFKLNENITLTLNEEKIARFIVEEVRRFLSASACVLFLTDETAVNLKAACAMGTENDEALQNSTLSKGQSITGAVMQQKEPLLINDLENNFYYKSMNKEHYLKRAFVSVPLLVQGEVLGVLNVVDKRSNAPFSKRDLELLMNVARISAVAFKNTRLHDQIQRDYLKTITTLALVLDARDPYTSSHSENVTKYALAIAREIGLDPVQTETLRRAGLLHDIGKIGIRDDVLLKPGKLNVEELALIKLHTLIGEELVGSLPFLSEVAVLVRQHHERFDGAGYPDGRKGDAIASGARILAVADTFDAMTTDRPYRKGLSLEVARDELIRNMNTQFDPRMVEYFLKALEHDPGLFKSIASF